MIRTVMAIVVGAAMLVMLPGCGGGADKPRAPKASEQRPAPENPRPAPGPSGGLTPDSSKTPGSGGGG